MEFSGYSICRAGAADLAAIQALFESGPDYFEIVQGAPPGPNEARDLLAELPPDKRHDDKFAFLVRDSGGAVAAVIDLVRDYPEPGIWFLGLIFVASALRSRGLGTRLLDAVCAEAKAQGGTHLRLGVVQANRRARALYDRTGFQCLLTRERVLGEDHSVLVDVMERAL